MNATIEAVLNEALMDEYKSRDSYHKVIETFGPARPFVNFVEAEQTLLSVTRCKDGGFQRWETRIAPFFLLLRDRAARLGIGRGLSE